MTTTNDRPTDRAAAERPNVRYLPGHDPAAESTGETLTGPPTQPLRVPAVRADRIDADEARVVDETAPVLDAELLTEEQYQARQSQKELALARYRGYRQDAVLAARVVRVAVTHQRTKTVVRHTLAYPVAGAGVVVRRWRDTHGANRYERQMRAAEAAGDQEALRYWQEADTAEKQARHNRVMDWVRAPGDLLKALAWGVGGLTGLLLALGVVLAFHNGDIADVLGPITALMDAIAFLVWFVATYGVLMVSAATVAAVFYLYRVGRDHAEVPTWLRTSESTQDDGDQMDVLPDEGTIFKALANLGIPGFNRAVKEGWRLQFLQPPTVDGKGWRTQVSLPPSCPVEEIVKRKTMLAHNLVRFPIEVWPTEPKPATLDLWVANPGVLSGPVDPWPLLADLDHAQTDYFTGVPVGVTIKGDVVRGRLSEANYVMGGMMGSGKSTLAIDLVCGAILDPLVDVDVVVMAENADYEPMKPRLRSLTTGAGEDTVDACMDLLMALYQELSVRGQALREHDARAVTRELAVKDDRLRPRLVIIDECQNLFMGENGKAAIELAAKLQSTSRKYAYTLVWLTPEPSKDACPRKLTATASNKACFAIGDQQANDAVLGTGSYTSGISAVGLTPKTDEGPGDIGTAMVRGFTAKPGLLRSFYIPQGDVHRVVDRALELREQTGITELPAAEQPAEPDHLANIAAVLGDRPRMRTQEVLAALAARDAATYRTWTFADLADALPDEAKPYKSDGIKVIGRSRVADALADRATDTDGDDTARWEDDE